MSWQDQVEAVNPPAYEDNTGNPPRLWWFNGVKQAKTPGYFYTKLVEHHPVTSLDQPWVISNRFDDEVGYEAPGLYVAVIGTRQQPFIPEKDTNGKVTRRFISQWVKGAQFYNEWLCFVRGIEYPVVLCSKGLTGKSLALILKEAHRRLFLPAERIAKRSLPSWSFWLPITTMTDDKNRVMYVPTGYEKNTVTPPALRLPDLPDDELIEKHFVGPDILNEGITIRQEYDAWLKEKRVTSTNGQPTAAAPAADAPLEDDPTDYAEVPW